MKKAIISFINSLCSPLLVPQIVGGAFPPGFKTEKVSVKHWVAAEAPVPTEVIADG